MDWNGVDWKSVLGGDIARASLADPQNDDKGVFTATMLFLDAAFREGCDQQSGRGVARKKGIGWATLSRDVIVGRARDLKNEFVAAKDRDSVHVGEGAFKDRWPEMQKFFVCLAKFGLYGPRRHRRVDVAAQKVLAGLSRVVAGEISSFRLFDTAARIDLRLRVLRSRYRIFQLSLLMDANSRKAVCEAHAKFLTEDAEEWVPVYDEVTRVLGLKPRGGMSSRELHGIIYGVAESHALHVASTDDYSHLYASDGTLLLTKCILSLLGGAFDPGDGLDLVEAAERIARRAD